MRCSDCTIKELMSLVDKHYKRNLYSHESPQLLMLGVMEEVGELAQEILLRSSDFTPKPGKICGDIEAEIGDVIVYLMALCLSLGIEPRFRDLKNS